MSEENIVSSRGILTLDHLYKMTSFIYGDRNSTRSKEATFAHFVEVCGMLTLIDRKKKRENLDFADALCKALAWYFPLLSKMRVKSVEELVFRKFPRVCPYCRRAPHDEAACKLVKGTDSTVSHSEVMQFYDQNWIDRPNGLNEWQIMFNDIYPRSVNENGRSSIGLLEELGELSEAVRVFDSHPHYFLGEAADAFSYIMGLANEHRIREAQEGRAFDFQREYISRYPGLCTQCGSQVCVCPAIPPATVGRMAKELTIGEGEVPFIADMEVFSSEGKAAGMAALESMGGYSGLADRLPFDRGDTNHALIQLCLKIAAGVEAANGELAASLRAQALKLGDLNREPGTVREPLQIQALLDELRFQWREIDGAAQQEIRQTGGIVGELADILGQVRVLFVFSNPLDGAGELNLQSERRSVSHAIKRGVYREKFAIDELPAATRDDLRRALLEKEYDVLHFSGHADAHNIVLVDENHNAVEVPLTAVADLVASHPTIKCVVLNACEAGNGAAGGLAAVTIAMEESVPDATAIEFSRGFYDALASGRSFDLAFKEGLTAVKMSGAETDFIKLIRK